MFDYLEELMLRDFFVAETTVGELIPDKKALFGVFEKIYLLNEARGAALYAMTQQAEVASVHSECTYYQHKRMKQYFALNGYEWRTDPVVDRMIDLKGDSIQAAMTNHIFRDTKTIKSAVCRDLTLAGDSGSILAMRMLGCLLLEGMAVEKNAARGLSLIRMTADWNDEEGLLMALYYDAGNREKYLPRLYEKLLGTGHANAFECVKAAYGDCAEHGRTTFSLLEKAFNQGILKRNCYEKPYARLIYSDILSTRDKEGILFSTNKEAVAETCALPLKLGTNRGKCDTAKFKKANAERNEEQTKILRALGNRNIRGLSGQRPLCMVSDSKFMLDWYAAKIALCFADAHVERMEMADLAEYDMEPTKNNAFVRNCDEDMFNVYFLFFRGDTSDRVCAAAQNFLQSNKREKFHLHHPCVTLNLSAVLPICFCDREHAKLLKPYCDLVSIAEPTKAEKRELIPDILRTKSELYEIDGLQLHDSACGKLLEYRIDDIDLFLESAIREYRTDDLQLTEQLLQPYVKALGRERGTYGFGGRTHEERHE